ncbi:MAG: hypothetical protein ACT4PY_07870 [Armatimonadota bacterium]
MRRTRGGSYPNGHRGERGIGVLAVLALIVVLDLLLLVAARLAVTAIGSTFQDQSVTAALHAAEAGLNHLMFVVGRNAAYDTGQRLPEDDDGDGRPDFGAQGERGWVVAQAAASADLLNLTTGETIFIKPGQSDGSRGNVLYAVGYVPTRASPRSVRVLKVIYTSGTVPNAAILSDSDLLITGNPTVSGDRGSVHANANLSISGAPTVARNATATGTYIQPGNPTIGGIAGGGRPRMRMPLINVAGLRLLADYELRSDGWVYAGQSGQAGTPGTPLANTTGGTAYLGWKRDGSNPVRWYLSGNAKQNGTYYVEGDAVIAGSPGSMGAPWRASIFATGSILITGSPVLIAKTEGFALVAGGDLQIDANPSQSYNGSLVAREQFSISGSPTIIGSIMATNEAASSTVVTGPSTISGNPNITYNGGGPGIPGGITVDLWQELISGGL